MRKDPGGGLKCWSEKVGGYQGDPPVGGHLGDPPIGSFEGIKVGG